MRFSIIIPIFNAEKYILESVNSVLNQTYKDFEIILVDDGSSDNSGVICERIQNKYPEIINVIHQNNQGQLTSRCNGAKLSKGDYCIYLDADDIIYPDCLETLEKTITDFSMPDIIGYNYESLSPSGDKKCSDVPLEYKKVYSGSRKEDVYDVFVTSSKLNSACNKAVKRSILSDMDELSSKFRSLRCAEDRIQIAECLTRAQTIVFIENALYCYRLFDGSVTRSFDVSQVEKFNVKILCKAEEEYLVKWGLDIPEWRMKLSASFLNNTVSVFCKFLYNSKTGKQRKQLIRYNWCDFVLEEYLEKVSVNPYVYDINKKLWRDIINKDYSKLQIFFTKEIVYKKLRGIKRKIFR